MGVHHSQNNADYHVVTSNLSGLRTPDMRNTVARKIVSRRSRTSSSNWNQTKNKTGLPSSKIQQKLCS